MCCVSLLARLFKSRNSRNRFASPDMAETENTEKMSLNSFEKGEGHSEPPQISWREKLAEVLKTNPVQYAIIFLVVFDSLIVVFEMLIDMDIIVVPENDPGGTSFNGTLSSNNTDWYQQGDGHNDTELYEHVRRLTRSLEHHPGDPQLHTTDTNTTLNLTSSGRNHTDHHEQHHHHHHHHHTNKEIVEHTLHYASLTILAIFVIEVICKVFAEGIHLLKHKAEVFDAIIVLVSFSMDIAFSFVSVSSAAKDATGLMVLLRLWRITRIINGVIMSVKLDADKKINEHKAACAKAEEEVGKLKRRIDVLETEVNNLRDQLKQHNSVECETTTVDV